MSTEKPIAVDPAGCACTECITGEYVPLDAATDEDLARMVLGDAANNTCVSVLLIQEWFDRDAADQLSRLRAWMLKESR